MTTDRRSRPELIPLGLPLKELPEPLVLPTLPGRRFDFTVRPPGSKSLTNRSILLAALAKGESRIEGALTDADDARRMIEGVRMLGAAITEDAEGLTVRGVAGRWRVPREGARLDLGNAGTAMRFIAGACLLADAPVTLDGNARMRDRPIGELGEMLSRLGCTVEWLGRPGFPPLRVTGVRAPAHAELVIGRTESSQFISALLLASPFLDAGLTLRLPATITSRPYVEMTIGLLEHASVGVRTSGAMEVVRVLPSCPAGFSYRVEPDASGATYFLGAAAIVPGSRTRVLGLCSRSLQGDARFAELLGRMGCETEESTDPSNPWTEVRAVAPLQPILADMAGMPDAAMTLASVASFAQGTSILRGLRTLRVKECDRVEATRAELSRLGVGAVTPVGEDKDAMSITPGRGVGDDPVVLRTYDDHRMAMALSLFALRRDGIGIENPSCVGKTYPGYWRDFGALLASAR